MKFNIVKLALVASVLACAGTVIAQPKDKPNAHKQEDKLFEGVTLTDAQKTSIHALREKQMAEGKAARDDKALTQEQRMEKMKASRDMFRGELAKVLTPEQMATIKDRLDKMDRPGGKKGKKN
jgi:Spy/CpxP family protein refolding chaperone